MTNPATMSARVLLDALATLGVRDIVLCPGSRSAPLAFAALALERAGHVRLHVRHDERVGAFTALGSTKISAAAGDPRPAVVITTSGTATANLHPAMLEASHSHLPLIALTADRPHELRAAGANQTT
ncbi:MAG TPA: thiamine pyrophosphate-binding protein, partial [Actinomycetales bacterium]|nr:thiamine pyrophosphate-binding protein [Actinomycetales bacterium]